MCVCKYGKMIGKKQKGVVLYKGGEVFFRFAHFFNREGR